MFLISLCGFVLSSGLLPFHNKRFPLVSSVGPCSSNTFSQFYLYVNVSISPLPLKNSFVGHRIIVDNLFFSKYVLSPFSLHGFHEKSAIDLIKDPLYLLSHFYLIAFLNFF